MPRAIQDGCRKGVAKIGDLVWTLPEGKPGVGSVPIPTKIIDIQLSMQQGLYNPHTMSGTIVVDRFAAATFTETIPPSFLVHRVLIMPALLLYVALPAFVADWLNSICLAVHFGSKPIILAILGAISKCNGPCMV